LIPIGINHSFHTVVSLLQLPKGNAAGKEELLEK